MYWCRHQHHQHLSTYPISLHMQEISWRPCSARLCSDTKSPNQASCGPTKCLETAVHPHSYYNDPVHVLPWQQRSSHHRPSDCTGHNETPRGSPSKRSLLNEHHQRPHRTQQLLPKARQLEWNPRVLLFYPDLCAFPYVTLPSDYLHSCIKEKRMSSVLLLGDSNGRRYYNAFHKILHKVDKYNCTTIKEESPGSMVPETTYYSKATNISASEYSRA